MSSHPETTRSRRPTFDLQDRLIKARRNAGLSQPQLGEILECGERTIRRIEASTRTIHRGGGKARPGEIDRRTVIAWAMTCGVELDWLEHGNVGPEGGDTVTHPITVGKPRRNYRDNTRFPILLKVAA